MSDEFTRFRMTWLDQVHDDPKLTSVARDIAFRLSRYFNRKRFAETGACSAWPSHDTIAESLKCSSKTVQRNISILRDRGHLFAHGKGGRGCTLTYVAVISTAPTGSKKDTETESKGGHDSPAFDVTRDMCDVKVDISVPKGGHPCPKKVDTSVLQTSLNRTPLINLSESGAREVRHAARSDAEPVASSPARGRGGVVALSLLMNGPGPLPPVAPFLKGREDQFPEMVLAHQAAHGWPDLAMRCQDPALWHLGLAKMAFEMVPVLDGSDDWQAWKAEYRDRGWPMPEPLDGLACFPIGGPKKLPAFLKRILEASNGSENITPLRRSS